MRDAPQKCLFSGGDDNMRVFRQVYGASRLLRNNLAFKTVLELSEMC